MTRTLATVCECAVQAEILAVRGPRALRRRLLELGLVPGTLITFVRHAPWAAQTVVFAVRHYQLILEHDAAQWIDIRVVV